MKDHLFLVVYAQNKERLAGKRLDQIIDYSRIHNGQVVRSQVVKDADAQEARTLVVVPQGTDHLDALLVRLDAILRTVEQHPPHVLDQGGIVVAAANQLTIEHAINHLS